MRQYDVYLVCLDPTVGHEIKKTRPAVVLSPEEMNQHLQTVMLAPMTTASHDYPTRVPLRFRRKAGWVVLDQIRTVDKQRLVKRLGAIDELAVVKIKAVIKEMLVD